MAKNRETDKQCKVHFMCLKTTGSVLGSPRSCKILASEVQVWSLGL